MSHALAGLSARSQISGRDGAISCARASARRCAFTGAVLPNDTACYGTFDIPGLGPTRFYLSEPTGTNRSNQSDFRNAYWAASEVTKTTNGAFARITETTNNTSHRLTAPADFTPSGNTQYCVSFIVGPATTAPMVTVTISNSWITSRTVATANLSTGVVSGVSGAVFPLEDGSKLVSFYFTTIASPAINNVAVGMSITGSEVYVGVGNFADIRDMMIEPGTIPNVRIDTAGAAVTHNADVIEWTPPTPIGSDCAIWGIYIPFGWSAAAGAVPPMSAPRLFEANSDVWRMYVTSTATLERPDAVPAVKLIAISSIGQRTHAVGNSFAAVTEGATCRVHHDLLSSAPSASGVTPYPSATTIRIGNRSGTDRPIRGAVCLGVASSITSIELAALRVAALSLKNKFNP